MVGLLGTCDVIARILALVAGVWLMLSPDVIGYGDPAATNDRIFGPIAASLVFVAMWPIVRPLRWGAVPAGVWLTLAPFALDYSNSGATVSSIVAGLVIATAGPFGGGREDAFGGGWSSLLPGRSVPSGDPPAGGQTG